MLLATTARYLLCLCRRGVGSLTKGAEEVTEATNITLEAFPDRTLFPLGLVWGRDSSNKYHSSHLISSRLTHKGATEHGPPTGRRARILTIAHCVIDNEVIVEEWLVRDNYTLAVQLGCDPHDLARQRAQKPAQKRLVQWLAAEYARVVDDSSVSTAIDGLVHEGGGGGASRICAQLHEMWNAGSTADSSKLVTNLFHKHAFVRAPAGRELVGHEDLEEYYASWFAAFPNARWRIDFATNACSLNGPTAVGSWLAVRWTMAGEHDVIWTFFYDIAWPVIYASAPLLFAPDVRSSSFGIASAIGKLGVMLSPWTRVAVSKTGSRSKPLLLMAVTFMMFWFLTTFIASCLHPHMARIKVASKPSTTRYSNITMTADDAEEGDV
ncbi:hypothetical protein PPROV_000414500 [Pycnococcus provasolii]|uniref:SnoaL-like domain-containing protein n=1 Tax=Pycnococcus provasolii TaxID=41880 RepID=A0A830HEC1_9CHLO|nr:hypothetical protein PPROV_000414500 [Pycnococcus provasolii]